MKDFVKIVSTKDLEAFHKRYLFCDGLVKNIHYCMADKSLFLTIECRDRKAQWLLLTVLINGVSGVRFLERQGNQEIISSGLRIIKIQNTGYLLTLDDESIEEPQTTKTEQSMEEESYMQLNYKDMKKWYNDNKELKEKY